MVHQHFMLVPVFTVTENVMLGEEFVKFGGVLDRARASQKIKEISDTYNLDIDPDAYIKDMPVGLQQRVEIIKLLFREADILIMDEPTAVLTPQEVQEFFKIMYTLIDQGKSIIFITHKLGEVLECVDRITVIRGGKVVGAATPESASINELASMMVGREIQLTVEKDSKVPGEIVLEVDDLKVLHPQGSLAVDGITFDVHAGEVLGMAGVQGNGQTELVRTLTGLMHSIDGQVRLLGQDITRSSPRQITELGSAHIPEDRQKDGLVLSFTIADNLVLNTYYLQPFSRNAWLDQKQINKNGTELVEKFDIRTPSALTSAGSLSGGNQQKVIVAREFSRPIQMLIASQPTRGLDVGSIEYIHKQVIQIRDEGCAVLLVSTELDEIMQLSDRIAVLYRGRIVGIVDAKTTSKENVGLMMAGVNICAEPEIVQSPNQEQTMIT
jgi:simple sugar transport system ATP-binding protein